MVSLEYFPCVRIFPGMKLGTTYVHLHRKYSIHRHELNHAQPAGAHRVWSSPPERRKLEELPNTTFVIWINWIQSVQAIIFILISYNNCSTNLSPKQDGVYCICQCTLYIPAKPLLGRTGSMTSVHHQRIYSILAVKADPAWHGSVIEYCIKMWSIFATRCHPQPLAQPNIGISIQG